MRFALFLFRRLLLIVVLAWITTLGAFWLFRVGVESPAAAAQINAQLGAGDPEPVQYLHYVEQLLHGNFGQSLTVGLPVSRVLLRALPPTLSLIIGGMALWLVAGVAVGTISALRPGSLEDRAVTGGALTAMVLPTFLTGLILLDVFEHLSRNGGGLWLQPGYVPFTHSPGQWLGRMILPWIAIAATQAGATARLTRNSVREVLGEDYIQTAYSKGLSQERVYWVHVLRASITPVLSSIGSGFGILLGSAAIIDQVFALGGIGQQLLVSVKSGDLMLIMGAVLCTVILISVVNLLTDIVQSLLDPRVRVA
ncbi:MAG TPA: ABC transporter permease [Streptosporangiaceae bacterium]